MNKELFRNRWLEITSGWDFNYKISQYHERYTLIFSLVYFTFYITFPEGWFKYDYENWDRAWGISYFENSLMLWWGKHCKVVYAPWMWDHCLWEVRRPDGTWVKAVGSWELDCKDKDGNVVREGKDPDGRWTETYDYTYVLNSGEVQKRKATVYVERRTWWRRWKWLMPWSKLVRQCIDVSFDGEVGERTGSWKGGTVGCGYDMLPNETPLETLRRMEKERKFK